MNYREMEDEGWFLVVSEARCKYKAPARYDDVLLIETTLARTTHARLDHSYRILRKSDGQLLAEAETTLACVDREGGIQPIPEKLLEALGRKGKA